MTDRPTCKTCPYWNPIDDDTYEIVYLGNPVRDEFEAGQCIRHAPRGTTERIGKRFAEKDFYSFSWPTTDDNDVCGEHPDMPAWIVANRPACSHPGCDRPDTSAYVDLRGDDEDDGIKWWCVEHAPSLEPRKPEDA